MDWSEIRELATSAEAVRVYALLAGVAVIACSFWVALYQLSFLRALEQSGGALQAIEQRIREARVRAGRRPLSEAAISRKAARIQRVADRFWSEITLRFVVVLAFGFVVPFILYTVGLKYYSTLLPDHAPLLDEATKIPVGQPSWLNAAAFVFDQLTRGAALDVLEVYDIHGITHLKANGAELIVRPLVLILRTCVELIASFIPIFAVWAFTARAKAARRRGQDRA